MLCQSSKLDLKDLCSSMFVHRFNLYYWILFEWREWHQAAAALPRASLPFTDLILFFFFMKDSLPPFRSRVKGFMHLFVCQHKAEAQAQTKRALGSKSQPWEEPQDLFADTLHKWLSVCPVCNWRLWIGYSTFSTYPFPAFFFSPSAFKGIRGLFTVQQKAGSFSLGHFFIGVTNSTGTFCRQEWG